MQLLLRKQLAKNSMNRNLRQQKHIPAPPIEQIEKQLFSLLSPTSFKPLKSCSAKDEKKLRERILTLPV